MIDLFAAVFPGFCLIWAAVSLAVVIFSDKTDLNSAEEDDEDDAPPAPRPRP